MKKEGFIGEKGDLLGNMPLFVQALIISMFRGVI